MYVLNLLEAGPLNYLDVDAIQRYINREVAALEHPDTFIVWEAQDVYTAGRRTEAKDIPDRSVPVIQMDRGGSVTYHGPGQLVIYPIVKVQPPKDVVRFVRSTERALIEALASTGLQTSQIDGRSGVWVERPGEIDQKLCAIGMKFRDEASMHGLALNVNTQLERFHAVVPCGLADADVTSLRALGYETDLQSTAELVLPYLARAYEPMRYTARQASQGATAWSDYADFAQLNATEYLEIGVRERETAATLPKTGIAWQPKS